MNIHTAIGDLLVRYGEPKPFLLDVLKRGVLSLSDSRMIIESPVYNGFANEVPLRLQAQRPASTVSAEIDDCVQGVFDEGLALHFHDLVQHFGRLLVEQVASEEQAALIASWASSGLSGTYLMTDAGGESMANWRTVSRISEHAIDITIDKIWGIEAQELGYAMVVSSVPNKPYPVIVLVPPDACRELETTVSGKPFLGGRLGLGDVRGRATLQPDCLFRASPATNARFLCSVRPRFVQALMAHVNWLGRNDRLKVDNETLDATSNLSELAGQYVQRQHLLRPDTKVAMVFKLLSNLLLLDIATSGRFEFESDKRDLLAFTKMEGSSYRCLYEVSTALKVRS